MVYVTRIHSKLTFSGGDLDENTVYNLWVGEFNTQFINGENPTVNYPSEVGNRWRVRFKIRDTSGNRVSGFNDITSLPQFILIWIK